MKICGIVCEYNPFHHGHAWQISEVRRILGEDTVIVCAMSGDFVQRGEAAVYPKEVRARAALRGGADLILELPLPWSISTAERFATAGVEMFNAMGCVTHLAFGSECAELSKLRMTAQTLLSPETERLLREKMKSGASYASARQEAVREQLGEAADVLSQPNDILCVEYLKAMETSGSAMEPLAIQRRGAAHDSTAADDCPSASYLRKMIWAGENTEPLLPPEVREEFRQSHGPVDRERMELALLSRLRFLPKTAFREIPETGEELSGRLYHASRSCTSLSELEDAAVTKRFTRARIRRSCLYAALGIHQEDLNGLPPYLRILAANRRGLEVLHDVGNNSAIPFLTKPASVKAMEERAQRVFQIGAAASDLYRLCMPKAEDRTGDHDWRLSPFIWK